MQDQENNEKKIEVLFSSIEQLGHFKPLVPFMEELKDRGHKVTVFVSSDPKYRNAIENEGVNDVNIVETKVGSSIQVSTGPFSKFSGGLYPAIMSYYQDKKKPDVIVYDLFASAMADVADKMKIPAISVCMIPLCLHNKPPKASRNAVQNFSLSLRNTFGATLTYSMMRVFRNNERKERNLPKLKFQDIMPDPNQERHVICTTADGFEFIEERSPLLQLVGPSQPSSPAPLGSDLSEWLNTQTKPIVYVAFGTLHRFNKKSLGKLATQLKSVSESFSVLWSLPVDQQRLLEKDKLPTNWKVEKFVPQWSVLEHPNVKLFVSHCGSGSTSESLLNEVPIIGCPCGTDQFANATRIKVAGVGVEVYNGASGNVADAIVEVHNNLARYENSTRKVKMMFSKAGGAKKATDIIEIVADRGYEKLGEVKPIKFDK